MVLQDTLPLTALCNKCICETLQWLKHHPSHLHMAYYEATWWRSILCPALVYEEGQVHEFTSAPCVACMAQYRQGMPGSIGHQPYLAASVWHWKPNAPVVDC